MIRTSVDEVEPPEVRKRRGGRQQRFEEEGGDSGGEESFVTNSISFQRSTPSDRDNKWWPMHIIGTLDVALAGEPDMVSFISFTERGLIDEVACPVMRGATSVSRHLAR